MKYYGYIKEHHPGDNSLFFKEYLQDDSHPELETVIRYLKSGTLCVPQMGFVEDAGDPAFGTDNYNDDENPFVGYLAVYTDGEWFWPEYIVPYLEKYRNFYVPEEMVQFIQAHESKNLSETDVLRLEKLSRTKRILAARAPGKDPLYKGGFLFDYFRIFICMVIYYFLHLLHGQTNHKANH